MGRLRTAVHASMVDQSIATAASLLGLAIAPIYIRYLGLDGLGLVAVSQGIVRYLTLADGGLAFSTVILVSHARGRNDAGGVAKVLRNSLALSFLALVLAGLAAAALRRLLLVPSFASVLRLGDHDGTAIIQIIGAQAMVTLAFNGFYDLLTGVQETRAVVTMQGLSRILGQVAGAVAAVRCGTATAVLACYVIVSVLMGCISVVYSFRRHPYAFRFGSLEMEQLWTLMRTGAKSFGLQVGGAVAGSAPVLAIQGVVGSVAVPIYTLPSQILGFAAGIIGSFAIRMQPAFGDAWAKGDVKWIRLTVTHLFEKILLLLLVGSAGFLAVGASAVRAWVGIEISPLMLVSVVVIISSASLMAWLKFVLSGINRHRLAALSELAGGLLTLPLTWIVCSIDMDAVGAGVMLAGAATSYWLLPREICRHLGLRRLSPSPSRLLAMIGIASMVYLTAASALYVAECALGVGGLGGVLVATVSGLLVFGGGAFLLRVFDFATPWPPRDAFEG